MKKRKIFVMASALVITAATLAGIQAGTAYAVEGWTNDGEEWKFLDTNDEPEKNVWRQSKDAMFYLGDDGVMRKNCFIEQGTGLYHVDERGARAEHTWYYSPQDDGQGHAVGWYYFGGNGKAYRGSSTSYKKNVDGKTYIFNEDGLMLTGWFDENGEPLNDGDNPLVEGLYYADEDGALKTNAWLDYSGADVEALDDLSSDISGLDYSEYNQIWLYFNDHSKKLKSNNGNLLQRTINGQTYGFDEYGVMLPWWTKVASVSNAEPSNPTSSESAKFFAGYNGGPLMKNAWLWMYPSENLLAGSDDDGEYSWWRTDQNGEVIRNRIKRINGRSYAFDGLGRMVTGFVLDASNGVFVAQYDSDVWTAQDFIDGSMYGNEKGDLYFFNPDELNDGSMQAGRDLSIELSDGVRTFDFKSNGAGYGSRNKLRRVKDSYYINGLRLDADENYGYGVIKDGNNSYRVVNTSGKLVSRNKKVVKDRDGAWLLINGGQFIARAVDENRPRWHDGTDGPGFYSYDPKQQGDKWGDKINASRSGLPDEMKLNKQSSDHDDNWENGS